MVRPSTAPIKKQIGFDETLLAAVEEWRRKRTPIPNLSEAIRRLVQIGLEKEGQIL